jgi:hypothetical protein
VKRLAMKPLAMSASNQMGKTFGSSSQALLAPLDP